MLLALDPGRGCRGRVKQISQWYARFAFAGLSKVEEDFAMVPSGRSVRDLCAALAARGTHTGRAQQSQIKGGYLGCGQFVLGGGNPGPQTCLSGVWSIFG